jgi:inhibitor of KinA
LAEVCEIHNLSVQEAIDLHGSATYIVYFLGFVPGFAYLGGLPEALVTPRLPTPRRRVPPGSVGIAGHQSGVYPFATPGGWRLIGRTPLAMFRRDRADVSFLAIGDQVHFTPISPEQFAAVQTA